MPSAISLASGNVVAVPNFGAGRPASVSTRPNSPRSSARSMAAGLVPTMGTPAASRRFRSERGGGTELRCRQTGFGEHATEFAAVLRQVDGCGAGSHDGDAGSFETLQIGTWWRYRTSVQADRLR